MNFFLEKVEIAAYYFAIGLCGPEGADIYDSKTSVRFSKARHRQERIRFFASKARSIDFERSNHKISAVNDKASQIFLPAILGCYNSKIPNSYFGKYFV
jgi:hypothetical protein